MTKAMAMPTTTETRNPNRISPAVTSVACISVPHCATSDCAISDGAGMMKADMAKIRTTASHTTIVTSRRMTAGSQLPVAAPQLEANRDSGRDSERLVMG